MKFLPGLTEGNNANSIQDFTPTKLLMISALAVLVLAAALYIMLRPKPELNSSFPRTAPQARQADGPSLPKINNDAGQHARSTGVLLQHAINEVDNALTAIHSHHVVATI